MAPFRLAALFIFSQILLLSTGAFAQNGTAKLKLGIDKLIDTDFRMLQGKRVALVTNSAGRTSAGQLSAEAFASTRTCELTAIFTPEHGFFTSVPAGESVGNDVMFNVPVYSLYGANRKPSKKMLDLCDVIVVDLQDIGVRSYTFLGTLYNIMDAGADYDKPVIVLDRPNPLGGLAVDGNTIEDGLESFVGIVPVAYIHGCTFGELAKMINEEGWLKGKNSKQPHKCDLTVVKLERWKRGMVWEDTGLMWFPTSPHIPTPEAARGSAALGIFGEIGIISIGIGTTQPFQYIGMPGFRVEQVLTEIGSDEIDGVRLFLTKYRPFYGMYSGKDCSGFLLKFRNGEGFRPYTAGIRLLLAIKRAYPQLFAKTIPDKAKAMFRKVTGSSELLDSFQDGRSDEEILSLASKGYSDYLATREKYLIYD